MEEEKKEKEKEERENKERDDIVVERVGVLDASERERERESKEREIVPDSWVKTAWQTEQGHILSEVVSCEVSGWHARCFLRLPSFT